MSCDSKRMESFYFFKQASKTCVQNKRTLSSDPKICIAQRSYDQAAVRVILSLKGLVAPNSAQFLQIANIVMKQTQHSLGMKRFRDRYYNVKSTVQIPKHNLEVMPGFITSIHKYDGGNLLTMDTTYKLLRMDTLLDAMYALYRSTQGKDLSFFHSECARLFEGNILLTRYNNKTYKLDEIAWDKGIMDTFDKNGETITYKKYYQDQPLVVSRPTERDRRRGDNQKLYIIPELCTITGLSDTMRKDFKVMRDLASHTSTEPQQRVSTVQTFAQQLNTDEAAVKTLKTWGMKIQPKVIEITGRELEPEKLYVKTKSGKFDTITYDIDHADWSRNMRDIQLLNAIPMEKWMILFPKYCGRFVEKLLDSFKSVARGLFIPYKDPLMLCVGGSDNKNAYMEAIRANFTTEVQLIVSEDHGGDNESNLYQILLPYRVSQ